MFSWILADFTLREWLSYPFPLLVSLVRHFINQKQKRLLFNSNMNYSIFFACFLMGLETVFTTSITMETLFTLETFFTSEKCFYSDRKFFYHSGNIFHSCNSGNQDPRVVQMDHSWKNISLLWKLISLWKRFYR